MQIAFSSSGLRAILQEKNYFPEIENWHKQWICFSCLQSHSHTLLLDNPAYACMIASQIQKGLDRV